MKGLIESSKKEKTTEIKTLLCGGVIPPFPEMAYKNHLHIIKGDYDFFEFPFNPEQVTIKYFGQELKKFLESLNKHQKAAIMCLSGSVSYLLQSKKIIEEFKDRIAGILFLNPVYSLSDVPSKTLRKQNMLTRLNEKMLNRGLSVYGLSEEEKNIIRKIDIETLKEVIKKKIELLNIPIEEAPYLNINAPIISVFTADDYPIDEVEIDSVNILMTICFPDDVRLDSISSFFKAAVQPNGLSPNYKSIIMDEGEHGALRQDDIFYTEVIKEFYDAVLNKTKFKDGSSWITRIKEYKG